MNRRPIIIDCDPGVDDAIAILLALRAPEFDLRALTPVAGNVPLDRTAPNALSILELAGARVPVYRGAEKPMFCELHTAAEIHGADGLHGFTLPEPKTAYAEGHAWDAIYREARALGGELEIIAVGPLTNLGIAFSKYPDLPPQKDHHHGGRGRLRQHDLRGGVQHLRRPRGRRDGLPRGRAHRDVRA